MTPDETAREVIRNTLELLQPYIAAAGGTKGAHIDWDRFASTLVDSLDGHHLLTDGINHNVMAALIIDPLQGFGPGAPASNDDRKTEAIYRVLEKHGAFGGPGWGDHQPAAVEREGLRVEWQRPILVEVAPGLHVNPAHVVQCTVDPATQTTHQDGFDISKTRWVVRIDTLTRSHQLESFDERTDAIVRQAEIVLAITA